MRRRTRTVYASLSLALLPAISCVPDEPTPSPYACGADPVVLGDGDGPRLISDDGNLVVIQHYDSDEPGVAFEFDVVDRRAGTNRRLGVSLDGSDGMNFWTNPTGTALVVQRYPPVPPGEPEYSRYDVATGVTTPIAWNVTGPIQIVEVSSDLETAIVGDYESGEFFHRSLDDGTMTPLPFTVPSDQWYSDFSPSLGRVVLATSGVNRTFTVVDVATNAVVNTVNAVVPSNSGTPVRFIDESTLLIDGARPAGSVADAIPTDDAFVVDVTTGATVRVDPGMPWATTRWSTPDGTRTRFVAPPSGIPGVGTYGTYIRGLDPTPRFVSDRTDVETDAAITVLAASVDRKITLTCF